MKYHPDSPLQADDILIDSSQRSYAIHTDGKPYRVKSKKPIEGPPRQFQKWVEINIDRPAPITVDSNGLEIAFSSTPVMRSGTDRKEAALRKLTTARMVLQSACEDLCNLEGDGYCKAWEATGKLYDQAGDLHGKLEALKPPTGVFQP